MTPAEAHTGPAPASAPQGLEAALADVDQEIGAAPLRAQLHVDRAGILRALGRHEEALLAVARSAELSPGNPAARYNLGCAYAQLGRFGEALAEFDSVAAVWPKQAAVVLARARSLTALGRHEDALAAYDRMLSLGVADPGVLVERAAVLLGMQRLDAALMAFERAAQLDPDSALAASGWAHTLYSLHRFAPALAVCDWALARHPHDASLLAKRAASLHYLNRFDEALTAYGAALVAAPHDAVTRYNAGLLHLLRANFEAGLPLLEARWQNPGYEPYRHANLPAWKPGMSVDGLRLLVWSEQGFGDSLQFVRYVPALAAQGARVLVEVSPDLQGLLAQSLQGAAEVIARGESLPACDLQVPLASLPLRCATRADSVPAEVPYLRADAARSAAWEARIGPRDGGPRVGICVSGNPKHANDRNRSIVLELLRPLHGKARLYLLQKELRPRDEGELERAPIADLRAHLCDFAESAAALMHLDLLISVDTSVVHLAGALARPVWILLPPLPDWRWMLGRDDSAWYPTARLFRRAEGESWQAVIERVAAALKSEFG